MRTAAASVAAILLLGSSIHAQPETGGYVSVMADVLPRVVTSTAPQPEAFVELRTRLFFEHARDLSERVRFLASGFAEGLVAERGASGSVTTGIVRPQEIHVEAVWDHADLRAGFGRVVWGRLDEFLPTDVVNPQDLTKFFLEGRAEGRLPVGLVRARWLPSDRFTLEGIYVPWFRRGRYDELDEATSPFNVSPVRSAREEADVRGASGGVRASITSGRVDWSLSAYRGFEPLPLYSLAATAAMTSPPIGAPALIIEERFPRFMMIGGDFETTRGLWGIRGETALFVDRTWQANGLQPEAGGGLETGVGVDRKAGSYRVSGNAVLSKRWADQGSIDRTDVTLVAALDRSFARETRSIRAFAVYNPGERSAFARVIASFSLRDRVALEASGGLFSGHALDALSLLASRDFVYLRLKVFY